MSNIDNEYKFKSNNRGWIGVILFLLLFFFVFMYVMNDLGLEWAIRRAIWNLTDWQPAEVIVGVIVFFVGPLILWNIVFMFFQTDCTIALHKSHMSIRMKDQDHEVQYRQIRRVFPRLYGLGIDIVLTDGSQIRIVSSFQLSVRNIITKIRIMNAIDRQLKKHGRKQ